MKFKDEQWAKVRECPMYSVSNYGRMKSRCLDYTTGELAEKMLAPCYSWQGRVIIAMRSGPKKRRQYLVHRLVMGAFGPPQPSAAHIVAHNDGDCRNNHISNLRWATLQENADDRIKHGTSCRGEENPKAILTRQQVAEIKATPFYRGINVDFAKRFGVSSSAVQRVRYGKSWAWS